MGMFSSFVALVGRLLIAFSFIVIGSGRLFDPLSASPQIAGEVLSPQVATGMGIAAIVLGIALALGIWMRFICILLAVLAFGAIIYLYRPYSDPVMQLLALQATGTIGGLLSLFAFGQTRFSYDAMRARRRVDIAGRDADIAQRDAELKARDAELRAVQNGGTVPVDPVAGAPDRRPFWRR